MKLEIFQIRLFLIFHPAQIISSEIVNYPLNYIGVPNNTNLGEPLIHLFSKQVSNSSFE